MHSVLVFTQFNEIAKALDHLLRTEYFLTTYYLHGGTARAKRDRMIETFQNEATPPAVFILSLKAGGVGITLTRASHVFHFDRWWNPAVEDQARDRVWRIGQTKTVICHRLVCPGTVDERVEEVVQGKRRIADMVLPKSSSLGDLNADQLRAALGINENQLLTADPDDILEDLAMRSDA